MDWSGTETALIATRAVHFAAVTIVVGSLLFRTIIAAPFLRRQPQEARSFESRMRVLVWAALITACISGAVWLVLVTASMTGLPVKQAMAADPLSVVVVETQFGRATTIRLLLAGILACCLTFDHVRILRWLGFAAAIGIGAGLAWTGHAGSATGIEQYVHLGSDILHLIAAAAWVGGLLPLVQFLTVRQRSTFHQLVQRFSVLGFLSVATLLFTGIVNSIFMVGSIKALTATEYGRVLIAKLCLFALMLMLAAINRIVLTPRLDKEEKERSLARGELVRNASIELGLGCCILALVAVLGILHPAIHLI